MYSHRSPETSTKGKSKGKTGKSGEPKKEAKGHGDLADLSKLNKAFGGVDIGFILSVPNNSALLLDGLDELL